MRRLPSAQKRTNGPPGPRALWTGSGTWLAGGIAAVHAAFQKLVTDFSDHVAENAIQEMEIAGLTVGDGEETAVRDAIRTLVTERLIEALRQGNEAESDVISCMRITTTREMLIQIFDRRGS